MKKYNSLILILITIFFVSACKKDLIDTIKKVDPGKSSTYPLNGEYWVRLDTAIISGVDTTWNVDAFGLDYTKITISNTSTDKGDSIWIDEPDKTFFPFKVKASCNPALRVFSVTNGIELYNEVPTTIKLGKLLLDKGITKGGNKTDSIAMHVFQLDVYPTTTFRLSGVRRTGFTEDDY